MDKKSLEKLSKEKLIEEFLKRQDEHIKLEKELRKYKNPNTPPSANKNLKLAF